MEWIDVVDGLADLDARTIMRKEPSYEIRNENEGSVIFQSWIIGTQNDLRQQVELHHFLEADPPKCFHNHLADSFRIILSGGYIEECPEDWADTTLPYFPTKFRTRQPGYFGMVKATDVHRIHELLKDQGPVLSLWFRGTRIQPVTLIGEGWGDRQWEVVGSEL